LVGRGLTEDSSLAKLALKWGIRDATDFVGFVEPEQLGEEYAGATVFVHPSLEESFGMSVAEAMSHGLPIVAGARAGAVPWLLDGGRAGLLVDTRDPSAIAKAVCAQIENPSLATRLGQAAELRVKSKFSPCVIAESAAQVFEDARRGFL
jgi:glycosyltransferase involved in cell wall biosynthesis